MVFIIIFLFISSVVQATETNFKWLNSKGGLFDGHCYEFDIETDGQNFLNKVKADNCRTNKTVFFFYQEKGQCLEIDDETNGKNYLNKVDLKNCQPKEVIRRMQTIKGKFECFSVDKATLGEKYYKRLPLDNCKKSTKTFYWKSRDELNGSCYVKENNQFVLVKDTLCRPPETIYSFKRKDDFLGVCYEIHPEGSHLYIKKIATKECKPSETIYAFQKSPDKPGGKCFEIDSETNGKNYINKVHTDLCK